MPNSPSSRPALTDIRNIYCIGRNYAKHAAELGNAVPDKPLVFLKSTAALRGLEQSPMAFAAETFHHEVELVFRVSASPEGNHPPTAGIFAHVALGIDLTRRPEQDRIKKEGHPWTLAKSFRGSAILGPWLPLDQGRHLPRFIFDLTVNGELRQKGDSRDMIHQPLALATYVHSFSPLQQGDIIYTGTPEGVGPLRVGDAISLSLRMDDGEPTRWNGKL